MQLNDLLKKENNNLELFRMLLAAFVIFSHTRPLNGTVENWLDPIQYLMPYTYTGSLAVKLFFFLSGLLVIKSLLKNRDVVKFTIARGFRIIPALAFVLILSAFVFGPILSDLPVQDYFKDKTVYRYVFDNLLFRTQYRLPGVFENNIYPNVVNGSLWSLKYLVQCYLFVFVMGLLLGKKNKYYLNIPFVLIIILTLIPDSIIYRYYGASDSFNLLPFSFALGAILAINSDFIKVNWYIMLILFVFLYLLRHTAWNFMWCIFFSGALLLYLSSLKPIRKLKVKNDVSYGMYVWAFFIQQCVYHYFGHVSVMQHFLTALIITLGFAYLSMFLVEKPVLKLEKIVLNKYNNLKNKLLNKFN